VGMWGGGETDLCSYPERCGEEASTGRGEEGGVGEVEGEEGEVPEEVLLGGVLAKTGIWEKGGEDVPRLVSARWPNAKHTQKASAVCIALA